MLSLTMTEKVSYADFEKLDIRVGRVMEATRIEGSSKLLRITVDLGENTSQVVWGAAKQFYSEASLRGVVGKVMVVLSNLKPKEIHGVTSEGMILEAQHTDDPEKYTLLGVPESVPVGSRVC